MSTENKLANKKRRSKKLPLGFLPLQAIYISKNIRLLAGNSLAMPKNGMTEGFSCYCWNTLFGFGEYDIFPVGVLAAIYMSEYVKDGCLKKLLSK
jgi:phosphate transport system permease protein